MILGNDVLDDAHSRIKKLIKDKDTISNLEETAEIIGIGAVKYSFLKISPFKYLAFDMEESINFEGNSGPYIQYTYVRAKSILSQGNYKSTNISEFKFDENVLFSNEEKKILRWLERFGKVVEEASVNYTPNDICTYILELAQRFNSFYHKHQVNTSDKDVKNARLVLTEAVAIILKRGLDLLGIKVVERM